MKISIIVPVYNVEKYLEKCLNSLVNQTLSDIEIIVVNDGSPDNSQEIINRYTSLYPGKVISLIKENGGLSDARNFALPYCRGEYIGFVDSDDYVDINMYQLLYSAAIKSNADMVMCDYYMVYPDRTITKKARKYNNAKEMFFDALAAAWNKIYRKTIINEHNICFPKGINFEDTEFYCKIIPYIKVSEYVPEPLVYYIQREGSIANTVSGPKTMHMAHIWQNILNYYTDNGFYDEYGNELMYFATRVLFGSHFERISRIRPRQERNIYANETLSLINQLFPQWRKNPYLKKTTLRNIYYKSINKFTIGLYASILNIAQRKVTS